MWSTARQVAAGDTVIVWLTRDVIQPLVVSPGKDLNTKFGNFRQADFVGVPYGSKVPSKSGRGFIHLLRPTPELWTLALPHRTQILYLADIAFITSHLNIRQGSKVIEAGTGSASFSHSIARTIGSSGHLYSYEFHEARFTKAKEEFERHGMHDVVSITHRNVCKDGFTVIDQIDSVFLDLPAPWDAVEHAKRALRKDRIARICCFSPCMEQVLRTVSALNEAGFAEITMYETLLRPIEVFQTPQLLPISAVAEKLKQAEIKRHERRLRQLAANRAANEAAAGVVVGAKRKRVDGEGEEGGEEDETPAEDIVPVDDDQLAKKKIKTDVEDHMDVFETSATPTPAPVALTPPTTTTAVAEKINVAKAFQEVRGHTSYLTFACLIPIPTSAVPPPPPAESPELES